MNHADLAILASEVVSSTIDHLPDEIRPRALQVPVHFQSQPDDSVRAEGFAPDILGLFSGQPHGTEYQTNDPSPPQIILYVDNIWEWTENDIAAFEDEVNLTYLHELGHYFGWDEDDLAARGLD